MANQNPNVNTSSSHRASVLAHLRAGNSITQKQALKQFRCARLAARIDELRGDGWDITTTMIIVGSHYGRAVRVAEYRLAVGVAA